MLLIKNGMHNCAVVYSANRDATDDMAVSEYCLHLRKSTNKDQRAYGSIPYNFNNYVFIGSHNEYAEKMGVKVPYEKFSDDTIYILVKDNYVVLDGGCRGKLYAVYEFLERFLGVRFYAPEETKICSFIGKDLVIPDTEIIYTPAITFRNLYMSDIRWNREFCARTRCNSEHVPLTLSSFGGSLKWALPNCHTSINHFISPDDEKIGFKAHPEYFSFIKAQNRRMCRFHSDYGFPWGEGDICWTNKEVRKILVEKMKEWILENPEMQIFSLSIDDFSEYCECPECEKLARKHGENGELNWGAPVLDAVNFVAREIKNWQKTDERVKNRTIYIETLAYHQVSKPPKDLKIEDNVIIRYCGFAECNYHRMDEDCKLIEKSRKQLEDWKKISKNIFIWYYANNHCMSVAYNSIFRVIQSQIKYLADNKIWGIFCQGDNSAGHDGPWYYIRQYLYGKILWNADFDFETEYKMAFKYFYGEGAPYLMEVERRFIENLENYEKQLKNKEDNPGLHLPVAYTILPEHYSEEFLSTATDLFEIAMKKVSTHKFYYNVRREYAYLKFIKMYLKKGTNYEEMQSVIDEFNYLGIEFDKMKIFISHFFGGKKDDLFLTEIEDRNRKNYLKRILEISR